MSRFLGGVVMLVAAGAVWCLADTAGAQGKDWGTVKGKVVWAGEMPKPAKLNVSQDKAVCLANGDLYDESLVVNTKNKGVKWVFIWLAPMDPAVPMPIHPALKDPKGKDVVLDQPSCMFTPRALAIREGQNLVVKNPAPMLHNIKWTGNPDFPENSGNQGIPPGKAYTIKELKAQKLPLMLECTVHPWMKARLGVFEHPYFAITDADGNFEIPNAPAGKFKLFVYQESIGWRNGKEGRNGQPVEIKAGGTDLGTLDLK